MEIENRMRNTRGWEVVVGGVVAVVVDGGLGVGELEVVVGGVVAVVVDGGLGVGGLRVVVVVVVIGVVVVVDDGGLVVGELEVVVGGEVVVVVDGGLGLGVRHGVWGKYGDGAGVQPGPGDQGQRITSR